MKNLILLGLLLSACAPKVGPAGPAGKDGLSIQGIPGATGATGAPGTPAISPTAIQLCPGVPTYGSVPEVGFCFSNKFYALFENNGSSDLILGELVPGGYIDHNGNLGCNFTVGPDCGVTN